MFLHFLHERHAGSRGYKVRHSSLLLERKRFTLRQSLQPTSKTMCVFDCPDGVDLVGDRVVAHCTDQIPSIFGRQTSLQSPLRHTLVAVVFETLMEWALRSFPSLQARPLWHRDFE